MPIEIEEDISRPPGYARLTLKPGLPAGQAIEGLQIGRMLAEQEYLGATGWHGKPVVLPVQEINRSADQVVLQVGPEIVDRIDAETRVSIEIVGPGLREDLFWPALAMSPPKDTAGMVLTGKPRAKGTGLTESGTVGTGGGYKGPTTILTGDPIPIDPLPGSDKPSQSPWLWAALVLVAATGLGGYYFFLSGPDGTPPQETVTASAGRSSWTDRYKLLQGADQAGAELLALHKEIIADQSPDFDTAFRALDLAAMRGNGQAAMQLAALYDPASFDERFFSKPNPLKAHEWYEKARAAQIESAAPAIENLCAASMNPPDGQAEIYEPLSASGKCN